MKIYFVLGVIAFSVLGIIAFLVFLVFAYRFLDHLMLKKGYELPRRLKYFCISIMAIPFGIFLLWFTIGYISDSIDLSHNGAEAVAIVKKAKTYSRRQRFYIKTFYINTMTYDGHVRDFNLDKEYPIGTKCYVVYSKENPNNAIASKIKSNFVAYYIKRNGIWGSILSIALPFFCLFVGFKSILLLFKREAALGKIERNG